MNFKTGTFILGMAVALNLAACAQNSKDEVKDIAKKLQGDDTVKAKDTTAQPGKIVLSGKLVQHEGAHIMTLDPRIHLTQITGVSGKEKETVIDKVDEDHRVQLLAQRDDSDLADVAANQNYVNIGCKDIDPALIAGLTETTDIHPQDGVVGAAVNTVMICGEQKTAVNATVLKADLLILNNAILKDSSVSGIVLGARRLMLIGESKIESKSLDISSESPSVTINIDKELWGEGSLTITTQGADDKDVTDLVVDQAAGQKADAGGKVDAGATAAPEATATSPEASVSASDKTSGAVQK